MRGRAGQRNRDAGCEKDIRFHVCYSWLGTPEPHQHLICRNVPLPASVLDQSVRRATWLPPPAVRLLCSRDHGNLSQERTGLELPHRASRGHIKETGRQSEETAAPIAKKANTLPDE